MQHHFHEAELGRQKDLVAPPSVFEPLANDTVSVVAVPVSVLVVPIGPAELVGTVEVGEALVVTAVEASGGTRRSCRERPLEAHHDQARALDALVPCCSADCEIK